jgi:Rha family phage regulatory protein
MNDMTTPKPQLTIRDGSPVVSSRDVAEKFGKQHDNVLAAVRSAECSEEFRRLNFQAATYRDAQNKPRPAVDMTRDGFCFIAMGFTGASAARWKEAYINAFNQMLARIAPQPVPATVPAEQLAAAHAELVVVQRKLIEAQERQLNVSKPKRATPKPITQEEIAQMRKLKAQGLSGSEIARKMGRNGGSVSMLLRGSK